MIDNGELLTIQKGRPYFFPNCKTDDSKEKVNLQYKLLNLNQNICNSRTNTFLNYYDITKRSIVEKQDPNNKSYGFKIKFSKMFIKKNGKFYSSPIPLLLNNFSLTKEKQKINQISKLNIRNTELKNIATAFLSLPKFLRISLYLCSGILMSPLFLSISLRIAPRIRFDRNDLIVFSVSSDSASIVLSSFLTALHKPS